MAVPGGGPVKKEYLPLGPGCCDGEGRPLTVLGAAVLAFAGLGGIGAVVITVPAGGEDAARAALPRALLDPLSHGVDGGAAGSPAAGSPVAVPRAGGLPFGGEPPVRYSPVLFTAGGSTRRASVHRALSLLDSYDPSWTPSWVLIHDGARPWVSAELITRVMDAVVRHDAVIPLTPLSETPKEVDEGGRILRHLRRSGLALAQTPQAFAFPPMLRAHEKAAEREGREGYEYTDDAEVWGEFCGPVSTVAGERGNRKITYAEDLC